jgi:hypothetical protein
MFIWIIKVNYELNLDKYGKPTYESTTYFNEKLGINNESLSKPPNKTQEWLMRVLGVAILLLATMIFKQEYLKKD